MLAEDIDQGWLSGKEVSAVAQLSLVVTENALHLEHLLLLCVMPLCF